ncbi:MAG: pyruvate synthase [Nitrososphaerota archaeon]|nr:pyruvate synthase [Nitrososphaerota archaeon]MDG7025457.1 pyruvate synthase [Nitrososphaerota archaeon]
MKPELMTGNRAAASAARLARVDYVPAYPITPQTEIIETIAYWVREGTMDSKFVQLESEHSMMTAAGAASLAGARVFTATSSQGLLYAMEMLYNVSGWRAPMVLANVSRALAAPIVLEPDHNDVLAARDSGFLQFHSETCQEVADLVLLAYRVAEDRRVMLPAIVNLDGFYLSFTREKVVLPEQAEVDVFLPPYDPPHPIRATSPVAKGSAVMEGHLYSYFRYNMHAAALRAKEVFNEAARDYQGHFGRAYGPVDGYRLEDADYVLTMSNSFTTLGRQAVNRMREQGVKAGLLKLRMVRPFPSEEVAALLRGRKAAAVFDQNLSPGMGGVFYPEVAASLYHLKDRPETLLPVVGGLGGKQLTADEMCKVFETMRAVGKGAAKPDPMFLMRADELARAKKALATAGVQG